MRKSPFSAVLVLSILLLTVFAFVPRTDEGPPDKPQSAHVVLSQPSVDIHALFAVDVPQAQAIEVGTLQNSLSHKSSLVYSTRTYQFNPVNLEGFKRIPGLVHLPPLLSTASKRNIIEHVDPGRRCI